VEVDKMMRTPGSGSFLNHEKLRNHWIVLFKQAGRSSWLNSVITSFLTTSQSIHKIHLAKAQDPEVYESFADSCKITSPDVWADQCVRPSTSRRRTLIGHCVSGAIGLAGTLSIWLAIFGWLVVLGVIGAGHRFGSLMCI
jgi:hypothetical protein